MKGTRAMTMELTPFDFFSLPGPVYMSFIEQAISTLPLHQAVNLRLINKFFDSQVCRLSFARDGIDVASREGNNYTAAFVSRYLLSKLQDQQQASNTFVSGLANAVEHSLVFMKMDTDVYKKKVQKIVCDSVAVGLGHKAIEAVQSGEPLNVNFDTHFPVPLAAALGARDYVKCALTSMSHSFSEWIEDFGHEKDEPMDPSYFEDFGSDYSDSGGVDMWLPDPEECTQHPVFGHIISVAAYQNQTNIIHLICDKISTDFASDMIRPRAPGSVSDEIGAVNEEYNCLDIAASSGHEESLIAILNTRIDFHFFPGLEFDVYEALENQAFRLSVLAAINHAIRARQLRALRILLSRANFDERKRGPHRYLHVEQLLRHSIKSSQLDMLRVVLQTTHYAYKGHKSADAKHIKRCKMCSCISDILTTANKDGAESILEVFADTGLDTEKYILDQS